MTPFEIARLDFTSDSVREWAPLDTRHSNWPVVYVLEGSTAEHQSNRGTRLNDVYVGESRNAVVRFRQHIESKEKRHLSTIRVVLGERFNKSVCLDLESYLIRLLAGDGTFRVLNRNDGIVDSNYYNRDDYQNTFRDVFDELRRDGVFTRSIPEIENSDLFKLSPFKALTSDQAIAVEGILEGLFADLEAGVESTIVVEGQPGTGKTVVAIYLIKLLVDIASSPSAENADSDSMFSDFFAEGYREAAATLRIGLVVPQQSLRESIRKVFRKTPGLSADMVLTPFDVGLSEEPFDLLIVDESHRLNQRANQPSGVQNKKFQDINERLFGGDDTSMTQLDWIRARSRNQILLLDAAQRVRPADMPMATLAEVVDDARIANRHYPLLSQMRVQAGDDYVRYIRGLFSAGVTHDVRRKLVPESMGEYDFRMFHSVPDMRDAIRKKDRASGLSRLVAGYAWEWKSKNDKTAFDIDIDGAKFRWNSTQTDWIATPKSVDEVGSIHTVQGYDLNYAGVIIGPDLRYDREAGRLYVDRKSYFDKKGKENNKKLDKVVTDEDLLELVTNIYVVLMTRGIRGTYFYVADPTLRAFLAEFLPAIASQPAHGSQTPAADVR